MKYLLDTCVISDFIKGEAGTFNQVKSIAPNEITVSTITIMEIQYGLMLNPPRAKKIQHVIHDFLAAVNTVDFGHDDAREAATIRALLKQQGNMIGAYDILIAGTALSRKLILVSANIKEFDRVEGLVLENWRNCR